MVDTVVKHSWLYLVMSLRRIQMQNPDCQLKLGVADSTFTMSYKFQDAEALDYVRRVVSMNPEELATELTMALEGIEASSQESGA